MITLARNQTGTIWKKESLKTLQIPNWLLITALTLIINLTQLGQSYAQTTSEQQKDNYKLYAHVQLLNASEYECFNELIFRESRWNVYADNGNHWGLGQGANKQLRNMDAYQQLDWVIRYIHKRYGTMCKALLHSKRKGWY